jgi:hypothetical protein
MPAVASEIKKSCKEEPAFLGRRSGRQAGATRVATREYSGSGGRRRTGQEKVHLPRGKKSDKKIVILPVADIFITSFFSSKKKEGSGGSSWVGEDDGGDCFSKL